ncbi:MAG: hypothetical protein A2V79_05895 [Betaproteobacteria bacterium RBG_16_56_24]|nr:MAG: hypothetical protein A2V79_05895 [Betaproteobacteria bacterium RBG_16_56_24]
MSAFEYTTGQERFFDYCLWEYQPVTAFANKFRSINLLTQSFGAQGIGERAIDIIRAIQQGFGASRTIWGIKQEGDVIRWEFYFYDYERLERNRTISRLLEIISPWNSCAISVNEHYPYFMFSINLDRKQLMEGGPLEEIQMYIGNAGSTVSSGICYSVTETNITLKNFYFFFDVKTQMAEIVDKICSSAYLDITKLDINTILWPEMKNCRTIVVANKRTHDGVYFSRINVAQLSVFLKRMCYPAEHISFVEQNKSQLDHMLYDVGFDYRMENGQLKILKSSYYGFF